MNKLKPLYLASNMEELNILLDSKEVGGVLNRSGSKKNFLDACKSLDRLKLEGVKAETVDQEKAYIMFMKYVMLVQQIMKRDDYKQNIVLAKSFFPKSSVDSYLKRADDIGRTLKKRYDKLTKERLHELTPIPATGIQDSASAASKNVCTDDEDNMIKPYELGQMLKYTLRILFIDTRPTSQFKASTILSPTCISISQDLYSPGMAASMIASALTGTELKHFNMRSNMLVVVLFDQNSTEGNIQDPLKTLYTILKEWDPKTKYKRLVMMDGGFVAWYHTFPTRITNAGRRHVHESVEIEKVYLEEIHYPASGDTLLDGCGKEPKNIATSLKGKLPLELLPFFDRKLKPYIPSVSDAFPNSNNLPSDRLQRRNSDSSKKAPVSESESSMSLNSFETIGSDPYIMPYGLQNEGAPTVDRSSKPAAVKDVLDEIAKLSRNIKAYKDDGEESTVNNLTQEIKTLKDTGHDINPAHSFPIIERNEHENNASNFNNKALKNINVNESFLFGPHTLPPVGLEELSEEHRVDVTPPSHFNELSAELFDTLLTNISHEVETNPAISPTPKECRPSMTRTKSSPDLVQLCDNLTPTPSAPSVDRTTKPSEVELAQPTPTGLPFILCGLNNLGNTCYMSASIQCLTTIPQFMDYFLYGKYQYDLSEVDSNIQLTRPFIKLLLLMEKSVTSVSPFHFKAAIDFSLTKYGNKEQHDSHEFLMDFLEVIHEELRQSKPQIKRVLLTSYESPPQLAKQYWDNFMDTESSIIYRNMAILMFSPVECQCGAISSTFSHDLSWSLPVPDNGPVHVHTCLHMYISTEIISDYQCEKCGGKVGNKAKKYIIPWRLPRVLLLHFNRFSNDLKKNDTNVLFPTHLDLQKFVRIGGRSTKYELSGVVNHFGTLVHGHYTAFVRNICTYAWTCNNDYAVYEMDEENIHGNSAYMLIYQLVE